MAHVDCQLEVKTLRPSHLISGLTLDASTAVSLLAIWR
jgi:hypothetical protein